MTKKAVALSELRSVDFGVHDHEYDERDLALYALAVGCTTEDLEQVYEFHERFAALPTFVSASGLPATSLLPLLDILPGYDEGKRLHAEQFLQVQGSIPSGGMLRHHASLVDLADKGRAAAVVCGVRTTTGDGAPVAYSEYTTFALGAGGFNVDEASHGGGGGAARPAAATAANAPPQRPPDAVLSERIPENAAALYRLSGDANPLHIDPGVAQSLGFERPILHGLCTMGIAARVLQRKFGAGGALQLHSLKVRFAGHVFPGEMLRIEAWKQEGTVDGCDVIFRAATAERGRPVLTHAALQLRCRQLHSRL